MLEVTRRDTTRQEIDLAIDLLFTSGSLICANLLAWAATDVLDGVARHEGITTSSSIIEPMIREDMRGLWHRAIKEHYNFAKHADRDPSKTMTLHRGSVEFALFSATMDYAQVYQMHTLPMVLFKAYFFAKHPDIFSESGADIIKSSLELLGTGSSREAVERLYAIYKGNKRALDLRFKARGNDALEISD